MDSDSWIQGILLVLFLMGAAYCAASEISYASINKIRMKNYADKGDIRAKKAIYISDHFDKALSTILIGNNVMHIAFASLATLLSTRFWGVESVKYTTIISTAIVFLISEMIPKSYAKANSERVALGVAFSLSRLMKILSPVASFFMFIGRGISKLFPQNPEPAITEEEFYDMIETAREEGVLVGKKQELLRSALDFDVITAGDILTKREDVVALDIDWPLEKIIAKIKSQRFSRLPVYKGSIDNVIGILQVRKFLKEYIKHKDTSWDIQSRLLDPLFVNMRAPIDKLLQRMSRQKLHMAIVTDGYGKTLGIITLEDILEELVGEIWDEDDIVTDEELV